MFCLLQLRQSALPQPPPPALPPQPRPLPRPPTDGLHCSFNMVMLAAYLPSSGSSIAAMAGIVASHRLPRSDSTVSLVPLSGGAPDYADVLALDDDRPATMAIPSQEATLLPIQPIVPVSPTVPSLLSPSFSSLAAELQSASFALAVPPSVVKAPLIHSSSFCSLPSVEFVPRFQSCTCAQSNSSPDVQSPLHSRLLADDPSDTLSTAVYYR